CHGSSLHMLKFWKKKDGEEAPAAAPVTPALPMETPPAPLESLTPKRTWRDRFAKSVLNRDVRDLFKRHVKLDDALLDELETTLIGADVGVEASTQLTEALRRRMDRLEFADAEALLAALRAELT